MRDLIDRIERIQADRNLGEQIGRVESYLQAFAPSSDSEASPVLFFNASTRIHRLSINAAFSLLASWGLRQAGVPVRYAVCQRGMEQCILGTNRENFATLPPCKHCIPFSERLFPAEKTLPLNLDMQLARDVSLALQKKSLYELIDWTYKEIPLGALCVPGLRWALRRHNLPDESGIRDLFRKYLASGANLVERFRQIFEVEKPRALVVFNGISYPEAIARFIAQGKAIPVFTHEVGLRPYSAFFSDKDATFREIDISSEGALAKDQEEQLSNYLEDRVKGKFTMADIQFWPEITDIPKTLQNTIDQHEQLVPIFTNVIFDTSQIHANTVFEDMFSWLEDLVDVIRANPETLFVLRAHPDEDRPGKESRESVKGWFEKSSLQALSNVYFFSPSDYISSYDLIRTAKVVLVYNSSIGLEASIMGVPVLCAGRARYTQLPTTYFPASRQEYLDQLSNFLDADEIQVPEEFALNARRFLHYELYRSSLDLSEFLQPYPNQVGMTLLKTFEPSDLGHSQAMEVIKDGIMEGKPFVMP